MPIICTFSGVEVTIFELFAAGVAVIPCAYRSKRPLVSWQQYQMNLPSRGLFERWFRPGLLVNSAVICGWRGLTVIDFDNLTAYDCWLDWCSSVGGLAQVVAAETFRVVTSKGVHVYIYASDQPRSSKFVGGDVKGRGGYVLCPPSIHPSGTQYVSLDEDAPILEVPRLADVMQVPPVVAAPRPLPTPNVGGGKALFPMTTVERIKDHWRIEDLLTVEKGSGRWLMAKCPFHDDHSPSFRIDTSCNLGYCWTCFGKPMDVIAIYAKLHNLDLSKAVKEMAKGL